MPHEFPLASPSEKPSKSTHITIYTSSANEFLKVSGQVIATVVFLYARRPIVLAGADQDLLGVGSDEAI